MTRRPLDEHMTRRQLDEQSFSQVSKRFWFKVRYPMYKQLRSQETTLAEVRYQVSDQIDIIVHPMYIQIGNQIRNPYDKQTST